NTRHVRPYFDTDLKQEMLIRINKRAEEDSFVMSQMQALSFTELEKQLTGIAGHLRHQPSNFQAFDEGSREALSNVKNAKDKQLVVENIKAYVDQQKT